GCPISMTYAAIPALRANPQLAAEWEPRFLSTVYDPRFIPAAEKDGALCGMAMTEKQGGSDVRANTARAEPAGGGEYEVTGHKWFCSAPMCDAFLVLAQAPKGLSCFLLPRFRPKARATPFSPSASRTSPANPRKRTPRAKSPAHGPGRAGTEARAAPT